MKNGILKIALVLGLCLGFNSSAEAANWDEFKVWAGNYLKGAGGSPEEAISQADQMLAQGGVLSAHDLNYVRFVKTIALMNSGRFPEAQAVAQEAVNALPGVAYYYVLLSDMQAAQGRYAEALATANNAVAYSGSGADLEELRRKAGLTGQATDDLSLRQQSETFKAQMKSRINELELAASAVPVNRFLENVRSQSLSMESNYAGRQVAVSGPIADMKIYDSDVVVFLGEKSRQNQAGNNIRFQFSPDQAARELSIFKEGDQIVIIGTFEMPGRDGIITISQPHIISPFIFKLNY